MPAEQKGEPHMREALTDAEVEREIAELEKSPLVALARKNNRLKLRGKSKLLKNKMLNLMPMLK